MAKTTMQDLAATLGVSISTISRALDPGRSHLISEVRRLEILSAAEEFGYTPNSSASNLARGKTALIGVVAPDLANPTIIQTIRSLTTALEMRDQIPLIAESMDDPVRSSRLIKRLLARDVDAILTMAATAGDREALQDAAKIVPVVLAVRPLKRAGLPTVRCDDVLGASLAAGHLADFGHRFVAQIQGPRISEVFVDRARGFELACTQRGISSPPMRLVAEHATAAEGYRLAAALIDAAVEDRPTAIFAHNDSLAIGAHAALRDHNLRCPEDISLVGFNASTLPTASVIPLTSVLYPSEEVGQSAADLLIQMLSGQQVNTLTTSFKPLLLARSTSARPPAIA